MEADMSVADFSKTPLEDLVSLEGRTAVITGGARGIGLAIAKRLAEAGANIVIADKDENGCLPKAVDAVKTDGKEVLGLQFDTRDPEAMKRTAERAVDEFGGIDIWVNDAGIYPFAPVMDLKQETWDRVIDTNITGVFNGSRAAIPHMMKKGGVILNLASVAGFQGEEKMAHYNTSKFAVRGLTGAMAQELGEHNIRVVGIAPTLVETPGIHEQKKELDKDAGEDVFKQYAEEIPLKRIGQPDDVARVALFLVSDMAAFVSGTTVVVDGGSTAFG
jgi:NAD(P)-dependent dehydrogenase (short-subunit alcohol dehydrogenase family)